MTGNQFLQKQNKSDLSWIFCVGFYFYLEVFCLHSRHGHAELVPHLAFHVSISFHLNKEPHEALRRFTQPIHIHESAVARNAIERGCVHNIQLQISGIALGKYVADEQLSEHVGGIHDCYSLHVYHDKNQISQIFKGGLYKLDVG